MMELRDIELLKKRFVDKLTLQKIADAKGLTKQRVAQKIDTILGELLHKDFKNRWIKKNQLDGAADELIEVYYLLGSLARKKFISLIRSYGIETVDDILKLKPRDIQKSMGFGPVCYLELKLALARYGKPYDFDTIDNIETKIIKQKHINGNEHRGLRLRFNILERDGFKCRYCGRSPRIDKDVILHVDHIHPVSKGGSWYESNLITACQECNLGKKDIILKKTSPKAVSTPTKTPLTKGTQGLNR